MLRGWGLDFIVAVDDDKKGRSLREKLKQTLYGGDEAQTKENLVLVDGCPGIEDVFSQCDFATHVLNRQLPAVGTRNSDYVKQLKVSKPVVAARFLQAVKERKLTWEQLDDETKRRIREVVDSISLALARK
ncbi:hypothetical protein PQR02_34445 [Paraburkholderia sediminicola]|uniref:Uncharacterized protein n=1 Tax=Paraburkholderia rhynchosiae TaxID=487049 RepID=A0ACC7NL71_9BURK